MCVCVYCCAHMLALQARMHGLPPTHPQLPHLPFCSASSSHGSGSWSLGGCFQSTLLRLGRSPGTAWPLLLLRSTGVECSMHTTAGCVLCKRLAFAAAAQRWFWMGHVRTCRTPGGVLCGCASLK